MTPIIHLLTDYPVFFDTLGSWVIISLMAAILLLDWLWLGRLNSKLIKWAIRIFLILINIIFCTTLFMITIPLKPMISELATVQRLIGQPVPDFSFLSARDSATYKVSDFNNDVIIINYWATYCGPCVEELPTLKAVEESAGSNVTIIAITDEELYKVIDFLKNVEAPTHVGLSKDSFLKMNGFLPVTVICKEGVIADYTFGRQNFDYFIAQVDSKNHARQ